MSQGCCCSRPTSTPVDFDSPEGKEKRVNVIRRYRYLSLYQLCFGFLAFASGATTIGLAIPNPNWPYLSCFPFVGGILSLAAGTLAWLLGRSSLENDVPPNFLKRMCGHYILSMIFVCGFGGNVIGHTISGIVTCYSQDNEGKCQPEHDVKAAFQIIDLVFAVAVLLGGVAGMCLYAMYYRFLAYTAKSANTAMETKAYS